MSQIELRKVFDVFIENKVVTELDFGKARISNFEIEKFRNEGVISKLGNVYILKRGCNSDLIIYGINLLMKETKPNITKAKKCFELALRLNPDNEKKTQFYIFVSNIKLRNYKEAIKYYEEKEVNLWTRNDYFFLYMLSLITELPEEYKVICRKYKVFFHEGKINLDNDELSDIKVLIMKFRLREAEIKIKERPEGAQITIIIKELVKQAREKNINLVTIFNNLKNNNIELSIQLLQEYLPSIKSQTYYTIIFLLINLGLITDRNYDVVMDILSSLENRESIKIDIDSLTERFNKALENNRFQEGTTIYKIFREIKKLGIEEIKLYDFSRRLNESIQTN